MEEKIFDLLNDVKVNFDEYDAKDLSPEEKKQVQERVLREVRAMRKNNYKIKKKIRIKESIIKK